MAGALLQSVVLPTAVASGTWSHLQGSRKGRSYVPFMDAVCVSPVRLQSFSGLHKSNMLDLKSRNVKDFWSVVSSAISKTLGKATRGVVVAMIEHYTEKAIKVIMLAQARRLGHNFVGTEQILIGLIGEGTGIASEVLESMALF